MANNNITLLPQIITTLPQEQEDLFNRLYSISVRTGNLLFPPQMVSGNNKDLHEFESQQIVHVTNQCTLESTLFNRLRAQRPFDTRIGESAISILDKAKGCAFCNPLEETPLDVFGRVEGIHSITASNMAKYDHLHAVIVFKEHSPFIWEEEKISDFLSVAQQWYTRAHEYDNSAIFPFFMWNCLWRAGASIVHGHAQVLLSRQPYRAILSHYRTQAKYRQCYSTEYYDDLVKVHEIVGLAIKRGNNSILAYLTPIKEKEVVIISQNLKGISRNISWVLSSYHALGVQSFNLAILMPKLGTQGPFITRLVDRGDLFSKSSDFGGLELYGGTSVVSSDPFRLIEALHDS